jgi:hypothetical protein
MSEPKPRKVVDAETGMSITGYVGQSQEELRAELKYRKDQLSVVPLGRKK